MGEPEKVEAPRSIAVLPVVSRWHKLHRSRFVRVQRQAVFTQSLGQYVHQPSRVRFLFEGHDKVVRVSDKKRSRLHLGLEPFVDHLVQVHVRQDGE